MRPVAESPTITPCHDDDTERDHMAAEFPAGSKQSGATRAEPTVSAPRSHAHSHRRRMVEIAVGVVILVAMYVFVLPQIASYTAVWRVIQRLSWPEAAALLAATLINLSTDPLPWIAVMPETQLAAGVRRDAGFGSDHLRRPGRRCCRPCGHVRDAARVGFLELRRERRRCADGHPQRACGARASRRCAGAAVSAA